MQRIVRKATKSKTKGVKVKNTEKDAAAKGKPRAKKQREVIIDEFKSMINVPRDQLQRWLNTPESRKLRFPEEPKNGKRSGEAILKILAKRQDKITSDDVDYMRRVIEFVGPRLQKRPKGDIVASNWRYSLMNWGHDPSKPLKRLRGKQNGK